MASPNWDSLSIQHSKNIGDPVVAATTDGKVYSSAQRDNHLNIACKRWLEFRTVRALGLEAMDKDATPHWIALDSYITEVAGTLASNTLALSSWTPAVWYPIAAYNATSSVPVYRFNGRHRFFSKTGGNTYLASSSTFQQWYIKGGSLVVDGSGATDSILLRYIQVHTNLSANGSTDILINNAYWGEILDLAFAVQKEEMATAEAQQLAQAKTGVTLNAISSY